MKKIADENQAIDLCLQLAQARNQVVFHPARFIETPQTEVYV
jgi:hypothetical protein